MKNLLHYTTTVLLTFCIYAVGNAQTNWHVSPTGTNNAQSGSISSPFRNIYYASTVSQPGDTVFIHAGTYRNSTFGQDEIWDGTSAAYIGNIDGTDGLPIVFTNHQDDEVILEFDGRYGLFVNNCSYLNFSGFKIKGIADQISLQDAEDAWGLFRLNADASIHNLEDTMGISYGDPAIFDTKVAKPILAPHQKPSYFNGVGFLAANSHHIRIENCEVFDCPGGGIRAVYSDYIYIGHNIVHNNTFWNTWGMGAIELWKPAVLPVGDTYYGIKNVIEYNETYNNENRIVSWINKDFVNFKHDEGEGISLQLANSSGQLTDNDYTNGFTRVANNICYRNGTSGIVSNSFGKLIIEHNTLFDNGTNSTGGTGGIGFLNLDSIYIRNNIVYAKPEKFALAVLSYPVTNVFVENNILWNQNGSSDLTFRNEVSTGWIEADPQFVDAPNFNFHLMENSPAIDYGLFLDPPFNDFENNARSDGAPDAGAFEYQDQLIYIPGYEQHTLLIHPNPTTGKLSLGLECKWEIYSTQGIMLSKGEGNTLDLSDLNQGIYLIKTDTLVKRVIKH